MVLKRIVTMALGAMGLGALAAGTASAQQIPAPDLFDGQVGCSSLVPSGMANAALGMTLGMTIEDGTPITVTQVDGMDTGIPDAASGLADILYVIDASYPNCGGGYVMNDAGDFLDAEGNVTTDPAAYVRVMIDKDSGMIAKDVAEGYKATFDAFVALGTADVALATQKMAYDALTDEQKADPENAVVTAYNTAVAKQTEARNELYAVAGVMADADGNVANPNIYWRGVTEWRAKGAVEMAVAGWNTALNMAMAATATLDPTEYDNKYVQVDSDQLLALVGAGQDVEAANINLANLRQYANADGNNASSQDSMTGAITGDSAFDSLGNLILPMELWDHDSNAATDQVLRVNPEDTSTFMTVNDRLTAVNNMVKALEDLQSGNQNVLMQPVIDEAVKRAKVEQAHYQTQFNTMIADNTDLRTQAQLALQYTDSDNSGTIEVDERTAANERTEETDFARTDFVSMKTNYDGRQAANTARDNAGVTLQTAFEAREMATRAVADAFKNPTAFYQQLVDRRQYLKDQADAKVTELAGMTGDDAPTQADTEAADKAAMDAATALTEAREAQTSFEDILADDSPVRELVEELLKDDDVGDDGGFLVSAIDGAYDAAAAAKTTADEAKTTADNTAGMIDGLTGDDGQVSMNERNISNNSDDIADLEDEVWGDASKDGMSRIDRNEADIMTLNGEVFDEDGMSRIDANEDRSMMNETRGMANAMEIGLDADGNGAVMLADGMTMGSRIDANEERSEINQMAIFDEDGMSRIATNKGLIDGLDTRVGMAETDITDLTTRVGSAESAIRNNGTAITGLRGDVSGLQDQMEIVRAGVAASMALAGMPAINGRGISLGVGSFDGESAFAVGFQIQGEMASFKVGVTSAGGETGASAGVGFQF